MPRLTRSGLLLCGICAMMYLASMQSTTGLLFLLIGIILACVVLNLFAARRSLRVLDIIPPSRLVGTEGDPIRGSWRVGNTGSGHAGMATVHLPHALRQSRRIPLLSIGLIGSGQQTVARSHSRMNRRGVYPYSDVGLVSSYPFGLVSWRRRLQVGGELIVFPRVYRVPSPPARGFEPMLGGRYSGRFRGPAGEHFHGVRPMQDGDPVRLIHWPSSARGRGIMVREFDEQLSGRSALLVQPARRSGQNGLDWVDAAARLAASLALAALDDGHRLWLATTQAGAEVVEYTPFSDSDAILEQLARLRAVQPAEALRGYDGLRTSLPGRAGVSWVLTDAAAFLAEAAASAVTTPNPPAIYAPEDTPQAERGRLAALCGRLKLYGEDYLVEGRDAS